MASMLVELSCPEHGLERFAVKVITKYNIHPQDILPKYRSRPKHELSSLIIGRSVDQSQAKDYLMQYFRETGLISSVLSVRLQK